jgi:hypothetical protein
MDNYNYEIDEKNQGTFSRKDNNRCYIKFSILSKDRLEIETFQCFPPIGTPSLTGVPRSGGAGKEMMFHFLMRIKGEFPDIKIIYLDAHVFPDSENMTDKQYQEYYSGKNLSLHNTRLHNLYLSLGFSRLERPTSFEGNIDHIISTIQKKGGKTNKKRTNKKRTKKRKRKSKTPLHR